MDYQKPEVEFVRFENSDLSTATWHSGHCQNNCDSVECTCVGTVDDGWEICWEHDECPNVSFKISVLDWRKNHG